MQKEMTVLGVRIQLGWFLIGILHFIVTLFGDHIAFSSVSFYQMKSYYLIKLMTLAVLLVAWQGVGWLLRKVREREPRAVQFLRCFALYFGILLIFLVLLWPGVWRWDEFFILKSSSQLSMLYWQHWLTSLFYMLALSIVPVPGGVVLMQILVITLIVAYIMARLSDYVRPRWVFLLLIPLCLPAVITSNLYPIRLGIYAYLELLMVALLFFKALERRPVGRGEAVCWSVLLAALAGWRSEGIFFLLAVPLVIWITVRKSIGWKRFVALVGGALLLFVGISAVQARDGKGDDYFITGIMEPLHEIIQADFHSDDREADLAAIDRVLSVEALQESSNLAFWLGGKREYSPQEYKAFQQTGLKLVGQNLPIFLRGRTRNFFNANGLVPNSPVTMGQTTLLDQVERAQHNSYKEITYFKESYPLTDSFFPAVRVWLVNVLEGQKQDRSGTNWSYPVIHSLLLSLVLLLATVGFGLVKKEAALVLLPLITLGKAFLVFLTAPTGVFMYHFPLYIIGLVFPLMVWLVWYRAKYNPKRVETIVLQNVTRT